MKVILFSFEFLSGYHESSPADDVFGGLEIDYETFSLIFLGIFAAAAFFLYQSITAQGRKRRRSFGQGGGGGLGGWALDAIMIGEQ